MKNNNLGKEIFSKLLKNNSNMINISKIYFNDAGVKKVKENYKKIKNTKK